MSCRHPLLLVGCLCALHARATEQVASHPSPPVDSVSLASGSLESDGLSTSSGHGRLLVRRAGSKRASVHHAASVVELSPSMLRPEGQLTVGIKQAQLLHPAAFRVASIIVLLVFAATAFFCSAAQVKKMQRARSGKQERLQPGEMLGKGRGPLMLGDPDQVVWAGIPRESGGVYPWHSMPAREALLAVGPTFHSNLYNVLPQCLAKRGLRRAGKGDVALVAMWNWPGERQRALVEMCLQDTLANKRALAGHLAKNGLLGMAPPTFANPASLRSALAQYNRVTKVPRLSLDVQQGLWFLKHAGKDNNTGVSVYKGVEALLADWEDPEFGDDPGRYLAQAEVRNPLLFRGISGSLHKVVVRAYVLVLRNGRCFLHRELLLKSHPQPYDSADPDPMRHVQSHVKYDGVVSTKGSDWEHYDAVWPRIGQMIIACFRSFDDLAALDDEDLDSGREPSVTYMLESAGVKIRRLIRDIGLSDWVRRRRGTEEALTMKYALLGLDVIVDEDLRPWIIELNRSPTLAPEPKDPLGTRIKADVIEDLCQLILDPVLQAAAAASKTAKPSKAAQPSKAAAQGKGMSKGKAAPAPEAMPPPRFAAEAMSAAGAPSEAPGAEKPKQLSAQERPTPRGNSPWSGLQAWAAKKAAGEIDDHVDLPKTAPHVASGERGFVELRQRAQTGAAKGK